MLRHQIFPISSYNFISGGVAGVIVEKREMYKTAFEYCIGHFWGQQIYEFPSELIPWDYTNTTSKT